MIPTGVINLFSTFFYDWIIKCNQMLDFWFFSNGIIIFKFSLNDAIQDFVEH